MCYLKHFQVDIVTFKKTVSGNAVTFKEPVSGNAVTSKEPVSGNAVASKEPVSDNAVTFSQPNYLIVYSRGQASPGQPHLASSGAS